MTNPIGLTGIPRHMGKWVTSNSQDVIYKNPKFNPLTEKPITIYCIHGTADRVASFELIGERLEKDLPTGVSKIVLASFVERATGKNIETFSQQLIEKIAANKDKNVILIGHSRGGLVASYTAEYLTAKENITVHSIITIGTPFWGSSLAVPPLSWISKSVAQMKKSSNFLTELRTKISASSILYYHYAAPADWLVKPDSTCVDAVKNPSVILKTKHGHLSMMSSHELTRHIQQNIFSWFPNESPQNNFTFLMNTIYNKINNEIKNLKARYHLWPSDEKERILMQLRDLFGEMRFGEKSKQYPHAQTVAEFINIYLDDLTLGAENKRPRDILNTSLIPLTHLFQIPKSNGIIEMLVKDYGSTCLPIANENKNNNNNEKQIVNHQPETILPSMKRRHSCGF